MAKSPFSNKFKATVSQEVLDRHDSCKSIAAKYKVGRTTLQQWIAKYRLYGMAAFEHKSGNASYTSDFKRMCVEASCQVAAVWMTLLQDITFSTGKFYADRLSAIMRIKNLRITILRGGSIWQKHEGKQLLQSVKR